VLVIGLRLGCLSVAFLTTEAILKDGLRIAGWVGNSLEAEMAFSDENIATLKCWLPMPCLGIIPNLSNMEAEQQAQVAASYLDLAPLIPIKSV
jgi:dethiobiotin synthetase